MDELLLTVGDVARAAGVTVRTLHHYDAVGPVRRTGRSTGGYGLYAEVDLDRLRAVSRTDAIIASLRPTPP